MLLRGHRLAVLWWITLRGQVDFMQFIQIMVATVFDNMDNSVKMYELSMHLIFYFWLNINLRIIFNKNRKRIAVLQPNYLYQEATD